MGENMRNFIKEYKEPFINDRKARLYEWEDKDGVRFRLVINDIKDKKRRKRDTLRNYFNLR